jgi:DNA polymerase I-like protein with 3'-5' exonuclease and polymerase domains
MDTKAPAVTVIDFETDGIEPRPDYPPRPAGFAIRKPGMKKSRYYAFGHPTENNCSKEEAERVLADAWTGKYPLLFQNAKFDYDVSLVHMGMKPLPWNRMHDTLYQLFLHNPHAKSFSLKPAATELLNMPPEERDVMNEWIVRNVPESTEKTAGAYIARAPGKLVGEYANGDVERTLLLHQMLYPKIVKRGMLPAYNRECELMPILLENETQGINVDVEQLSYDVALYKEVLEFCDSWLRKRLNASNLNIDGDKEFADALERCGVVTEFNYTKPTKNFPNGQRSVSKKNLTLDMFNDKQIASVYGYRNRLATCLRMFMESWLNTAVKTGGLIHTSWNQVRQSHGTDARNFAGARTGRLSSSPNFQNIPKGFEDRGDGWEHPAFLAKQKITFKSNGKTTTVLFPQLPLMRKYLLPDNEDHVWGHRDYSQQELRILAHFEDGELLAAYLANPKLDVHSIVHDGIKQYTDQDFIRGKVKQFVFQRLYGGGVPALTSALGCDVATIRRVLSAMDRALPGYHALEKAVRSAGRQGDCICTQGGREYYSEPASFSKKHGRMMTYEYKLLNYLIQGSAADCTKQALINYHNHPKRRSRFLVTVHDEINCSMPRKALKEEMAILNECMMDVKFDLPMLSEGKVGENWGSLTKLEE